MKGKSSGRAWKGEERQAGRLAGRQGGMLRLAGRSSEIGWHSRYSRQAGRQAYTSRTAVLSIRPPCMKSRR